MRERKYVDLRGNSLQMFSSIACTLKDRIAKDETLQAILTTLQGSEDYEAKLVVDDNGDGDTYLEVRIYNPETGTFDTPVYFQPGSTTPIALGSLTAPIVYINPNTYLAQILADTTSIDTRLTAQSRTPNFDRVTGPGSIATTTYDVAVANVGVADGTVLGSTIKPGETLDFNAGALNNFYTSGTFTYDGTGTELILIYNS